MKEAELLVELGASFRAAGGWWFKIPDPSTREEVDKETGKKRRWMLPIRRPFDAIAHLWRSGVVHDDFGTWYAIETKVTRSPNFQRGIKAVADHQWKALAEVAMRGMHSRVLVLVENRKVNGITNEFAELAVCRIMLHPADGIPYEEPYFLQREAGRWPVEKL